MNNIVTATGKEFRSDYIVTIPKPKMLYARILEAGEETVRAVFGDPAETETLVCGDREFIGYTVLKGILDEGDALKVVMENAINDNS